jgi:hypothetical protein
MSFFSFLKYTFIIFAAHLATSGGAPFEYDCLRLSEESLMHTAAETGRLFTHLRRPSYSSTYTI